MLSKNLIIFLIIVFSRGMAALYGQVAEDQGHVTGTVVDAETGKAIQYTNVSLYQKPDSSFATGTMSDSNGRFSLNNLPAGTYKLVMDFIGYKKHVIPNISVTSKHPRKELDTIQLDKTVYQMEGVDVKADASKVQYKVDKKVINVSRDLTSAGGTAVDALENVPSVNVDIEGNISMRGSQNFKVLVNGNPTALEGSDALRQIPASRIKNIEIITNPSAKYDPEGTGGIINVITRKQKYEGLKGIFSGGVGINDKYNAAMDLTYKGGIVKLTGGLNFKDKTFYGEHYRNRITHLEDTTYHLSYKGNRNMKRGGTSGNMGIEIDVTPNTMVGISGKYGVYRFSHGSDYRKQRALQPGDTTYYITESNRPFERTFYSSDLNFKHQFQKEGHQLKGFVHYSNAQGKNQDLTDEWESSSQWTKKTSTQYSVKSEESDQSNEFRLKLDYTYPFSGEGKLEAGLDARWEQDNEDYTFREYTPDQGWVARDTFRNSMEYSHMIHGAYVSFEEKIWGIEFQSALRTEYTDRSLYDQAEETRYRLKRYDFFPTFHLTRKLPRKQQVQLNYSRRINRPRGWYLEPFVSYMDEDNIRKGNPKLEPEYIDAYEANWKKRWDGSFLSIESYYRVKHNMINRYIQHVGNNVVLHSYRNIHNSSS